MDCNVHVNDVIMKKDGKILDVIPFNSGRKRATTAIDHPDKPGTVRVFCKGAPEIVLDYCNSLYVNGEKTPLDDDKKAEILKNIVKESFAPKAYRTLLVAYTDFSASDYQNLKSQNNDFKKEKDREVLEADLCVAGIFALQDPLRPEIVYSAQKCFKAGINIRMVTGDNIDTATAIAIEAGILNAEDKGKEFVCMEGQRFREEIGGLKKLEDHDGSGRLREEIGNKAQFRAIAKNLKVLARSTPEDKYMLVTGLKELNKVVAVTGDGTNDAPALKKADVGFAMGITGTEVAKEASDIILLDDNFASIITAVRWGRNIYTNVRKFLQFQLTVNVVAMFVVFLGGVVLKEPPLTSVQILWVNLIMDTFAALALATEPPSPTILDSPPYSRTEMIVTHVMWRNILGQGFYQACILCTLLFAGKDIFGFVYDDEVEFYPADPSVQEALDAAEKLKHYTMVFHTFVLMQVFNEINARKLGEREFNVFKGFFNNWLFLFVIILTLAVQGALVEYAGRPARCVSLTYEQHAYCVVAGMACIFWGFFVKCIPAKWFSFMHMKEEIMTDEEEKEAFTSQFRKSFRQSHRRSSAKVEIN